MKSDGSTLNINMLGEFSFVSSLCRVDDQSSRSKKVWTLLQYLIANRFRDVSQNDLIDTLWPEGEEIGDPANTLKTIVHRARTAMEPLGVADPKDILLYRGGTYSWNNDIPVLIDAEEFSRCCDAAERTSGDEKLKLLMGAIELYHGDFLPKSSLEQWAMPLTSLYRTKYIQAVHSAVEMLREDGNYEKLIAVCRKAAVIDPYDESIHFALIQALVATGDQQEAMNHYNYVTEMFFTHFGVTPSEELTQLYKEIVRTSKSTQMDLGVIRDGLEERERAQGAFYCEYEFFKDIYRLEARSASRNGQAIHIALVTVLDGYGKKLTTAKLNTAMLRLREIITASLRRGGVFTRYSVSQFMVMLPSASFENADMVLNRITRNFRHTYPKMEILLHFSILPLNPLM